jgi:hypothetical protein
LGRDSACQVRFDESFETVSRRHAAIVKDGENWKIIPISQTNSTLVNGQPIVAEQLLNSGDEIRLSSKGPLMGFIIPQGKQSLVSSIGMTERLSLFRQQALRPYKRGLWALAIILILAVAGLVAWNLWQADKFSKVLDEKQAQIEQVQEDLTASDELINELSDELVKAQNASAAERARVKQRLEEAQAEREALLQEAENLKNDLDNARIQAEAAGEDVVNANARIDALQQKLENVEEKQETKPQPVNDKDDISNFIKKDAKKPVIKK